MEGWGRCLGRLLSGEVGEVGSKVGLWGRIPGWQAYRHRCGTIRALGGTQSALGSVVLDAGGVHGDLACVTLVLTMTLRQVPASLTLSQPFIGPDAQKKLTHEGGVSAQGPTAGKGQSHAQELGAAFCLLGCLVVFTRGNSFY